MDEVTAQELERLLFRWDPKLFPRYHCCLCLHATVYAKDGDTLVRCARGHDKPKYRNGIPLQRMIREAYPSGFKGVGRCADFEPSGDEEGD